MSQLNGNRFTSSLVHCGTRIDYEYTPPLEDHRATAVFLPGLFTGGGLWQAQQRQALRLGYGALVICDPFVTLDLGRQPMACFRDCLEWLAYRHGIHAAVLCGSSVGALMAIEYGALGRRKFHVVVSDMADADSPLEGGFRGQPLPDAHQVERVLRRQLFNQAAVTAERVERIQQCLTSSHHRQWVRYVSAMRRHPVHSQLQRLMGRLSLVVGEHDESLSVARWASMLRDNIDAGQVNWTPVPRAARAPMIENPDEVDLVLTSALCRAGRSAMRGRVPPTWIGADDPHQVMETAAGAHRA
ncbi:alpha/beta hydrolase [Ideonella sp. DXS29W]|uniref:Alpha/beta hydrolase n=1 Tax=Ideonella lacteola TaxID=2984193 RepID=A0ABU9BTM2_9BURK